MHSGQNAISTEMRECGRFITKDRALVLISPDSNPVHVIDISENGLAFKYLGKDAMVIKTDTLALYYENKSCLDDIPFETVSDDIIKTWSNISYRRCGIKFGNLTSAQQVFIDDFIAKYTY